MSELKLTPIDQIEDMADGVPVLAVEGTVKYAQEVKTGTSANGHAWSKQFFVLTNGTAEIACSMWDAEGNEVSKGESVHIENTQNKKGVWSGMIKGSYQKNGECKHTLEIRANQVKIQSLTSGDERLQKDAERRSRNAQAIHKPKTSDIPKQDLQDADPYGQHGEVDGPPLIDRDWPEAPATAPRPGEQAASSVRPPNGDDGVMEARKHLCRAANLYVLCVKCVDKMIANELPNIARTQEQFQATLASIWIEASSRRSDDGIKWWSFVDLMPDLPLKHNEN